MSRIDCPNCGHGLKFAPAYSGRKAMCRKCGNHLRLPSPDSAESSTAEAEASAFSAEPEESLSQPDSADVKTKCSHCLAQFEISKDYLGQTATCKECGEVFTIEEISEADEEAARKAAAFAKWLEGRAEEVAEMRSEAQEQGFACLGIGFLLLLAGIGLSFVTPYVFIGALVFSVILMLRGAWMLLTGHD